MSIKLPFLQEHGWPKKAKISGVSKYGFSEDDELAESAAHELIESFHSGDHKRMLGALHALIEALRSKHAVHEES
jgi:hypothetical protein